MWRLANILLVIVLIQFASCELLKQKVQYAYKGKIITKNVASDKLASLWTISGILSVEDLTDYITFKLDDVKTRIFNGDPINLNKSQEKEIPENALFIQEPFMVYPGDTSGYNITHKPNEPIWSLNMKRSIASIFFLNTDRVTNKITNETTIYGNCEVKYKIANDEGVTIWKTIDSKNCEDSPVVVESNVEKAKTATDFEVVKQKTQRVYHFDDSVSLRKIEAVSMLVYQSMPSVKSKQIVEQSQEFNQISNTTAFDPINISELTKTSSIIFDNSEDETNFLIKEVKDMPDNKLIDFYKTHFNIFKEHFNEVPFINDEVVVDTSRMYYALREMNEETLLRLQKKIFNQDDVLLDNIFVSYLPQLGTVESLKFIKNLVKKDDVVKDLYIIKMLATLPDYIDDVTEELVEQMEDLLNVDKVENNHVRYAAYLCFARIISKANSKGVLSIVKLNKYLSIYAEKMDKAEEDYETQMAILLSYVNMANGIADESIFDYITNNEYSRHLRILAAYGFKEYIIGEAPSEIYGNLWPIVKNGSEPFEVRVACLDIILYSKITEDQFKNIVNWYKDELREPSEKHLANYMYTTLKALQNTTGYYEHLGDLAAESLANMKPLKINKAWSTGNYRMAYTDTDANFGASFQARLISNPITHVVNSAFLTVDSFAHSFQLGRYSLYIKAEGIADELFSFFAINDEEEMSIPKLVELIQKNAYVLKTTNDIHIDVVIFCNNQAIYSMHISKDNVDNYASNPLFAELITFLNGYNTLTYPVFDYNYYASDLGTRIQIQTDTIDLASYEAKGFQELTKSSSSSEEDNGFIDFTLSYYNWWYYILTVSSYNPLLETSISTYKDIVDQKLVNIPFAFNLTTLLFQWKHTKDAFGLTGEHEIGTFVEDEEKLYEYCQKCSNWEVVNTDEWKEYLLRPKLFWRVTGVTLNITYTDDQVFNMNNEKSTSLLDIMEHHQSITFDNIAKPFLLLDHYLKYNKYINRDLFRYSIRSSPFYDEETPTETFLELSYNTDDNTHDDHPIARQDLNISIALTTRKQNDAEILGYGNMTFKYFSDSETNRSDIQPHIHHKYDIEWYMYGVGKPAAKICIVRDVQYPSRRTDKFSLEAIDNVVAITTLKGGDVENVTSACPNEVAVYFKEIYSANDKQKVQMLNSPEYKICKEQSQNLKYTPPTDDCLTSHEMISKYEICDIYADFIDLPPDSLEEEVNRTEHGVHLLRYNQINETYSKVTLFDINLPEKLKTNPELFRKMSTGYLPLLDLNPRVVAYGDDDLEWGFSSSCFITANRVHTFTGHTLKKYYEKAGVDTVALIECTNTTNKGITIQKYGDKYVGFQFYSFNETIVVSVPNNDGQLKIQFNDEIITKTHRTVNSEYYKFYFLDDNVIFISSPFINIFYTGEYIQLEIMAIYNNYICGLCSETQHF